MSAWLERLASGPPALLDGGLGTQLIARGLVLGEAPEVWNLTRPDDVTSVHRAYVAAGSEAVHTNTLGASPARLAGFGLADQCEALNRAAVALARAAGARFVIGDVGPTGESLARAPSGPSGRAGQPGQSGQPGQPGDPGAWTASFAAQGRALAGAGVDALHVETMSDVREASIALAALRQAAPGVPIMVSLTFDQTPRGFVTYHGDALGPGLTRLVAEGADVVGANCTLTSAAMGALAAEALAAVAAPLVLQPNAGQPRVTPEGVVYDQEPEVFAEQVAALAGGRVRAVGGCCGTDPRFIAALAERLGQATA